MSKNNKQREVRAMQQIINSQRSMESKGMNCLMIDSPQVCYRAVLCQFKNKHTCTKWLRAHQQLHKYEFNKIGGK